MSNIMGDFFQILWPSQNIWTLVKKCLFPLDAYVVSCPTVSKKSWKDSIAYALCLQGFCGNYGTNGKGVEFDHLQIPRASTNAIPAGLAVGTGTSAAAPVHTNVVNDNFCGGCLAAAHSNIYLGAGPAVIAGAAQSVCSRVTPFLVRFVTDVGEGPLETVQSGFNLQYLLT